MANEVAVSAKQLDDFDWDRQAVGNSLGALVMGTTGAQVRGGVVPANGNPLGYAQKTGLVGTLEAGRYVLPVSDPDLGPLLLWLADEVDLTHDTANGANPRTDLIIAEVCDIGEADGTPPDSFARFRIVKGVAGAGATPPSTNWVTPGGTAVDLGNGAWAELHRVLIPASGGSGAISTVTDRRTYTAAAGGVVRVDGAAATPALAASLPPGAPVWDEGARRLMFRDAASGLVHPLPIGLQSQVSVYSGAAAIAPATLGYWADGGTPMTFQAGQSFGAQIGSGATSADIVLPSGVFAVWAQVSCLATPAAVAGQYARIDRSSDGFPIAAQSFVGETCVINNPAVFQGAFPTIVGRVYNPAGATRNYQTYMVIARLGSTY